MFSFFRYWKHDGVHEKDQPNAQSSQEEDGQIVGEGHNFNDDLCQICFNQSVNESECKWCGCDKCTLWYHAECLSEIERERENAELSSVNGSKWLCVLSKCTRKET